LSFPGPIDGAFLRVHLKLEPFPEKSGQGCHKSFSRFPGPNVNVAVVGIAAEAVASLFQLLVQFVQNDVA